jgi:hypothetical protein
MTLPDPPRELAFKRSAEITRIIDLPRPVIQPTRVLRDRDREVVLRNARTLAKQGRLARAGQLRMLTQGEFAGYYVLPIELKTPKAIPAWRKPVIIAGSVLAAGAALVIAALQVLSTLAPIPLGIFLGLVGGLFALRVWHRHGRREVTVTTVTTVRVR